MRIKRKFISIIVISCLFWLLLACSERKSEKTSFTTLVDSITVIPNSDTKFLHRIQDVYVMDNEMGIIDAGNQRAIFFDKYTTIKNQISILGNEGRGPGEFILPNCITFNKEFIFVSDFGTRRINIFEKASNRFIKSIDLDVKLNFAVNENGNLLIPNIDQDYIVREYDTDGEIISKFGSKFSFEDKNVAINHNYANVLVDNKDNTYIIFVDYPIIQKYNRNRVKIWETNLNYLKEINNRYEENLTRIKNEPFLILGLLKDVSIDDRYLYISPVCKKKSTHDILKLNLSNGEFEGYIDIPDGKVTISKLIVNSDKVIAIDLHDRIYVFEINR